MPDSIAKAVAYLEARLPSLTNPYAVAMTSYALANEKKLNREILYKFASPGFVSNNISLLSDSRQLKFTLAVQPNNRAACVHVLLRVVPLASTEGPCLPAGGHSLCTACTGESRGKQISNWLLPVVLFTSKNCFRVTKSNMHV